MDNVYQYLLNSLGLSNKDAVIVAVSGGPDSMALLHLFTKVREKIRIDIVCAHVNHNTNRPGQIEEQQYVENFCKNHNIIIETMMIETYETDNFENEARTKRYTYFEKIVKQYKAKYLFTAHHGDDLIETILMRIVRGSTLAGYGGFSKEVKRNGYMIIRPFIELTKEEIITYNKNHKIHYFIDSSNLEDVHTRNRFRKYVVPILKNESKNIHKKFYKFSRILLEYNSYIDKEVKRLLPHIYNQQVLNIEKFEQIDRVLQLRVIYYLLEHLYQDNLMLINDRHVELLLQLISSKKVNTFICLPNNLKVVKSYNCVTFVNESMDRVDYKIQFVKFLGLPNGKRLESIEKSDSDNNDICRLCKDTVKFPLYVRTRKAGDKMYVKGMLESKKVKDIFIDCKIPMHERNLWPIVVDSDDVIVWIPGLKKSKFDKTKLEKYDIILKYY